MCCGGRSVVVRHDGALLPKFRKNTAHSLLLVVYTLRYFIVCRSVGINNGKGNSLKLGDPTNRNATISSSLDSLFPLQKRPHFLFTELATYPTKRPINILTFSCGAIVFEVECLLAQRPNTPITPFCVAAHLRFKILIISLKKSELYLLCILSVRAVSFKGSVLNERKQRHGLGGAVMLSSSPFSTFQLENTHLIQAQIRP